MHFENFTLQNVLCIPSFKLNLISISKLLCDSPYRATFADKVCTLQDQSERTIGTGTEHEGLYYLNYVRLAKSNGTHAATNPTIETWHQRLGHRSNKIFTLLTNYICNMEIQNNSSCLICPLAKQTILSFPISSIQMKVWYMLTSGVDIMFQQSLEWNISLSLSMIIHVVPGHISFVLSPTLINTFYVLWT